MCGRKKLGQATGIQEESDMELQEKLDGFRANFEADLDRKTSLDTEALRLKRAGVEEQALKAGQRNHGFPLVL